MHSDGSTWRNCQGSRICNTSYDEKIQAINFNLSNVSTALNYKVLWNLSFKKTSASEWNHVKGLMFGYPVLLSISSVFLVTIFLPIAYSNLKEIFHIITVGYFRLSFLENGCTDTSAKKGICLSFGCKPGIAENRILLDETKNYSIKVIFNRGCECNLMILIS